MYLQQPIFQICSIQDFYLVNSAQGTGDGGFGTGNEFPDSTNPVLKDDIKFNRMTRTFNGNFYKSNI